MQENYLEETKKSLYRKKNKITKKSFWGKYSAEKELFFFF